MTKHRRVRKLTPFELRYIRRYAGPEVHHSLDPLYYPKVRVQIVAEHGCPVWDVREFVKAFRAAKKRSARREI